jgi:hypothetical protein
MRPDFEVGLTVGDDGRLAGRAGRSVDAGDPVLRHGDEAERIGVAQIGLGGERELLEILEPAKIVGRDARGVELGASVGNVVVGVRERRFQALELERGDLVARRGFDGVEVVSVRCEIEHSSL